MAFFTPDEFDDEILHDLKEEIVELYEASEQTLIELELTPQDNELQRALFRCVHTIKGDLGLVGFTPMINVLQHLEDLLDLLRKGEISYTSTLSDFVMCLMDKVTQFVSDCIVQKKAEYDNVAFDNAITLISKITSKNIDAHERLLTNAVNVLLHQNGVSVESKKVQLAKTGIPKNLSEAKQIDLLFFREVMRPIEKRSGYKEGRGDRLASLAFYINSFHESPLAEDQLAVACYVHDFGMAFMPFDVVSKNNKLSPLESNLLRSHVYKSTRLIEHLNDWDDARKIVMQHHENVDGSGYPLGLKGDEICEGAKLLAILDRYDNLVHRPNIEGDVLTPKEAVIFINKQYKGQLSTAWLRLFNKAMTEYLTQDDDS